jgi:hypothetical protein
MARNYLERIAMSAAGTSAVARPPVTAPPLLPGIERMVEPAIAPLEIEETVVPEAPATIFRKEAVPSAGGPVPESRTRVDAPDRAADPVPYARIVENVRSADPPLATQVEPGAYTFPAFAPGITVRVPKTLGPTEMSVPPESKASSPVETAPAVSRPMPPHANPRPAAAAAASIRMPRPDAAQASPAATNSARIAEPLPTPVHADRANPPQAPVALPPAQAPPLLPSRVPAEQRTRLHIGQLDVQVINAPPNRTETRAFPGKPEQKGPAGSFLEARFLEKARFRL